MEARKDVYEERLNKMDASGKACLGEVEASPQKKEPTVEELVNEVANPKVPKDEAAMVTVGVREDLCEGQQRTVGFRNHPKKQNTNSDMQGIPKGRTFRKRCWVQPKKKKW
jgi:hypothetical protein